MRPYKGWILVKKIYEENLSGGIKVSTDKVYKGLVEILDVCEELENKFLVGNKLKINKDAGIEMEENELLILENHILMWE